MSEIITDAGKVFVIVVAAPELIKSGNHLTLQSENQYQLIPINDIEEINKTIAKKKFDVIVIEDDIPDLDLLSTIIKIRSIDPDISVILITNCSEALDKEAYWSFGIDDCIRAPFSPIELVHRIARAIKVRRLSQIYSSLRRENNQLRQLSQTDGLTQLANRRFFNEALINEFIRTKRYGGSLGCLMIDIDHFKRINDTYGHMTGDMVLKNLAKIITRRLRSIDVVARWGGEEFVVLLPETSLESIEIVAEKLRIAVESHNFNELTSQKESGPKKVTISIGCISYPHDGIVEAEDVVELADKGLYQAKRTGRNKVVYYLENTE